jgi:hypothetical protein
MKATYWLPHDPSIICAYLKAPEKSVYSAIDRTKFKVDLIHKPKMKACHLDILITYYHSYFAHKSTKKDQTSFLENVYKN